MPACNSIAPTFLVPDVSATAEWYRTYLDFKADFFPKSLPYVFASLHRDGIEIMLLSLASRKFRARRLLGRLYAHERTS
jgi:hypothetical protein